MNHDAPEDRDMTDPYATLPFDQIQSHLKERVEFFERLQQANPNSSHIAERLRFYRDLYASHKAKHNDPFSLPF